MAFTAPSITATIQQGGSLYQAQFAYEQYGEWQGTILRKTLNSDGTVDHDENSLGNWDAAKRVKLQSAGGTADPGNADGRNIWTAIGSSDANYIGNWDNVNETNAPLLEPEMERLGYQINNYYTSSSTCAGDDTTKEELNQNNLSLATSFTREIKNTQKNIYHHIGIYIYNVSYLERFVQLEQTQNEKSQKLEQLRLMDNNIEIDVGLAKTKPIGVDTDEDYLEIKKIMEYKN